MNSGSGWLGTLSVAAATLIWLLCPSVSHANSLFVDDFETGDSGAWSQEAVAIPATGAEESVGVKFLPATENGVLGHYGVSLFASPNASGTPELLVGSVGGRLGHVYKHAIRGFQAELSELQAERLSRHPLVKRVVQERYLENPVSYVLPHCFADLDNDFDTNTRVFPPLPGGGAPVQQNLICSNPAPGGDCIDNWGPDRVDQNGLPRDQHFSYRQAAGSVTVYVIDTGVAWTNWACPAFLDTNFRPG